jgi:hypothetical protein
VHAARLLKGKVVRYVVHASDTHKLARHGQVCLRLLLLLLLLLLRWCRGAVSLVRSSGALQQGHHAQLRTR